MKKHRKLRVGENAFCWFLLAFSLFLLGCSYQISGFSSVSSPGMFPLIAASIMVLSAVLILTGNRKAEKPATKNLLDELHQAAKEVFNSTFLIYSMCIIVYMIILKPLHFLPSSYIFLTGSIIYLKGSTPLKSFIISALTLGVIYLIFHYFFRVVLP